MALKEREGRGKAEEEFESFKLTSFSFLPYSRRSLEFSHSFDCTISPKSLDSPLISVDHVSLPGGKAVAEAEARKREVELFLPFLLFQASLSPLRALVDDHDCGSLYACIYTSCRRPHRKQEGPFASLSRLEGLEGEFDRFVLSSLSSFDRGEEDSIPAPKNISIPIYGLQEA